MKYGMFALNRYYQYIAFRYSRTKKFTPREADPQLNFVHKGRIHVPCTCRIRYVPFGCEDDWQFL